MLWINQSWDKIEIDTYDNIEHMKNICLYFGIVKKWEKLQDYRDAINNYIQAKIDFEQRVEEEGQYKNE